MVLDNHATHKTPGIKTWLLARPSFHLRFTTAGRARGPDFSVSIVWTHDQLSQFSEPP